MLSITKARNYLTNARCWLNAEGWRCRDIFLGAGRTSRVGFNHPSFTDSDRGNLYTIHEFPSFSARKEGNRLYVKGINTQAVQVLYNEVDLAKALNVDYIAWGAIHYAIQNYEARQPELAHG